MPTEKKTVMVAGKALRILARELNSQGWQSARAFYCELGKFNNARIRKGLLQISMCQIKWITPVVPLTFSDGSGNVIAKYAPDNDQLEKQICASSEEAAEFYPEGAVIS